MNQNVSLDASGTTDDAAIANSSYEWDLDDDGQYDDATGQQLNYSFSTLRPRRPSACASRTPKARPTPPPGASPSWRSNSPPQAAFGFSPTRPNVNQTVSLRRLGLDRRPADRLHRTTTGTSTTTASTTTPPAPRPPPPSPPRAARTVGLRVTDSNGVSDTASHALIVNAPPSASFGFSPQSPVTGQLVGFNASASSDDLTLPESAFDWDLDGDGAVRTTPTGRQPSMIYNTAGTRTVRLRVTDSGGVSDMTTASVSVTLANTPPVPAFVITPTSPDVGDQVSVNAAGHHGRQAAHRRVRTPGTSTATGQYDDATGIHRHHLVRHGGSQDDRAPGHGLRRRGRGDHAQRDGARERDPGGARYVHPGTAQSRRHRDLQRVHLDRRRPDSGERVRWDFNGDGVFDRRHRRLAHHLVRHLGREVRDPAGDRRRRRLAAPRHRERAGEPGAHGRPSTSTRRLRGWART